MAAKKKPNPGTSKEANTSTEVQPSTNNALVTTNGNNNNDEDNGENISVDDLAEGEFEVDLTTRKWAKGHGQRYRLLLQPVLMQQQLVPLARTFDPFSSSVALAPRSRTPPTPHRRHLPTSPAAHYHFHRRTTAASQPAASVWEGGRWCLVGAREERAEPPRGVLEGGGGSSEGQRRC